VYKREAVVRVRQVVDWEAAIWAGLIGGALYLVVGILLPWIILGDPWLIGRIVASLILGPAVVAPQDGFRLSIFLAAVVVHFVLSVAFAYLVAFVIHRGGIITGLVGGALVGLALYSINFYTASYFFPWTFPLRSWMWAVAHLIFGALVGVIYELLEEERLVPVGDSSAALAHLNREDK
jgi:hypothetical protein